MALTAGTKLGPYEIVAPLGAGGMGEVYRAHDTRLGREVAVKVLPEHLSQSEQAHQRFEREARSASGLNHPNICAVYDIGSHEGVAYMVMELLEGESLAQRLERGPMPMAELLAVAIPLAEALDRAHSSGLVHRDLKPGNVMLTPAGAKLVDFGLAKGLEVTAPTDLTATPTMTSPLTAAGMIVGTFQYMSPEQLEGHEADVRSDLWAFGSMLYEMATGLRAFEGKTQASLIASIMKEEPRPIPEVAAGSNSAFDHVVRRCLTKEPENRWQTARDLLAELRWIASGDSPTGEMELQTPRDATQHATRLPLWAWAVAAVLAVAFFAGGWFMRQPPPPPPAEVLRATMVLPEGTMLDSDNRSLALSPDGSTLAYTARGAAGVSSGIWMRRLDSQVSQLLTGTEGATYPFWSPDGSQLGFFADGKLRKMPATGGTAVTLCDADAGRGASWGANDVIVFAPSPFGPLLKVASGGGTPTPVTTATNPDFTHRNPHFLPDGLRVLYYAGSSARTNEDDGIYSLDVASGESSKIMSSLSEGFYVEPGYLAFVRDGNLVVQPMDPDTLELSGEPVPLAENIQFNDFRFTGTYTFADNGLLLYRTGASQMLSQLTWFDFAGKELGTVGDPAVFWLALQFSPDGRQIATTLRKPGGMAGVWLYDLERGIGNPFTFDDDSGLLPTWSPDGRAVAYTNGAGKLFIKAADGLTPEELIHDFSSNGLISDWSVDGKELLLWHQDPGLGGDLAIIPAEGGAEPRPYLSSPANEFNAQFSPDGNYLAVTSDSSGRRELYMYSYPETGGKWQISTDGSSNAYSWMPDGSALIYETLDEDLMRVPITITASGVRIGAAERLMDGRFAELGGGQLSDFSSGIWGVAPDGERLLIAVPMTTETMPTLTLVSGWAEELK